MRNGLSASEGLGAGVPPAETDDANIVAGQTTAFNERTLDGMNASQTMNSQRVIYKGGQLAIRVKLKGFELTEDLYLMLSNNPDIRDAICSECGIRFAQQGASS
jgi:hypothetical protein